ncbi:MAG: hypothetical protein ACK4OH_11985 [Acidovorax temperans]|uniref:hypothetical protein n=1 Tax=Acidovorax temperans TaxID=80878 RepID=UPI00391D0F1F
MKIIKTRFLDFFEGNPRFFEKSHFKISFSFHRKYENFSEFYNLRQMSDNKNHQISRENSDPAHDFYEAISVKNGGKQILRPTSENGKFMKTPW